MTNFCVRVSIALSASLIISSVAIAAIHDRSGAISPTSRGERIESPDMRRQSVGNSHMLQLYETWMVELFCSKARNRKRLSGEGKICTPDVIQKLLGKCSAKIRKRGPRAYFKDAPEGAEFLRIVQSYQDCLRRGADRVGSGQQAAGSRTGAGS